MFFSCKTLSSYLTFNKIQGGNMKKVLFFCIAVLLLATSCATITKDGESFVNIQSNVEGATVSVDGFKKGKTPVTFVLENDKSYLIQVEKEGYEPQNFRISKKIRWGAQIADLFLFTGFANVIDLVTPNGYELSPTQIYVELEKK